MATLKTADTTHLTQLPWLASKGMLLKASTRSMVLMVRVIRTTTHTTVAHTMPTI